MKKKIGGLYYLCFSPKIVFVPKIYCLPGLGGHFFCAKVLDFGALPQKKGLNFFSKKRGETEGNFKAGGERRFKTKQLKNPT